MPWICQAFDSHQNSGGNNSAFFGGFYRDIMQCFDRIFARI